MTKLLVFSLLLIAGLARSQEFSHGGQRQCGGDSDCPGGSGNVCVLGVCISLNPHTFFGFVERKAKKCSTIIDCGPSQVCADGKCVVDNGHGGLCSSDAFCPNGFICIDGKCAQRKHHFSLPCVAECPPGTICKNGVCTGVPNFSDVGQRPFAPKLCSTGADCGPSQFCADGKCVVDNGHGGLCSSDAYCPNGFICIDGKCAKSKHRFSLPCVAECPPGTICKNGVCTGIPNFVDVGQRPFVATPSALPCVAECPPGTICKAGVCVGVPNFSDVGQRPFAPKLCSTGADCGPSQFCADGKCVVDNGHGGLCSSDAYCPNGFICIDGKCAKSKRRFAHFCIGGCPRGMDCNGGVCEENDYGNI